MKKHKFSFSSSPDEFSALALVSPEKDYRLCFLINKVLHVNLDKSTFVHAKPAKTEEIFSFPAYCFNDEREELQYYIIKNKNDGNFLVPQLKQVDYIFILKGKESETLIENIKREISKIPNIHSTFAIANNHLTHLNFD